MSARIPWFDYGSNAAYYITICTKRRISFFGTIVNEEMILSEIGEIVKEEWIKTPSMRPELNLILDDFVIMPNHIHGIIIIRSRQGWRPFRRILAKYLNSSDNFRILKITLAE
jgi:REP-associated tyrosine transposase